MKNKKGFTLIELLAIIVILAIIAVITVPIILNIIENSKKGAAKDSAYGYKDAVQKYSIHLQTEDSDSDGLNGSYTVEELKTAGLRVSGQSPDNGTILIDEEGMSGCLEFDEYAAYVYNNKIISTSKGNCPTEKIVTSDDGLYKSEIEPGRLIYKGEDPNNRIFIKEDGVNNTLYRIVSYEPDGTIKVVRDEKLSTEMAWDSRDGDADDTKISGPRKNSQNTFCNYGSANDEYFGCNVWGNMNNTYYNGSTLNPEFKYRYYSNNATETLQEHATNKGTVTSDSTLNTYLNGEWLNSTSLANYIENHDFYVGGVYYYSSYAGGDKGLARERQEEKSYTWNGKIGLLAITEYAESSLNPTCTSVWSNFFNNPNNVAQRTNSEWPCKYENYNYRSDYTQWAISPYSYNLRTVWEMWKTGYFDYGGQAYRAFGVRPAFYLKSSISLSGSGALGDEYTID